MFEEGDVCGVAFDKARAARKSLRLGLIGGVAQSKHLPAIMQLKTLWEPVGLAAAASPDERTGRRLERLYGLRWYFDCAQMLGCVTRAALSTRGRAKSSFLSMRVEKHF
ncbi:MAG: hypothetical protein NT154_40770 [Verrucomicrobia bacterium]|nr:hypothetical protein [Verrucomicrobiota bacterium]